jgi:elongation factor Tu
MLDDAGRTRLPKPTVTVGTVGHFDHGKTTLTAAIVARLAYKNNITKFKNYKEISKGGTERDDLKTVTIHPALVEYETPVRRYWHLDCPGSLFRPAEVVRAVDRMDAIILVVDAEEGPRPQTCEYLALSRGMDVPSLVVFLNETERCNDPQLVELLEMEVRLLLSRYDFPADDVPVVHGNAIGALCSEGKDDRKCRCIDDLVSALDRYVTPRRYDLNGPFWMPVTHVFVDRNRGTVVHGRIRRGQVRGGDEVEIVGLRRPPRKAIVSAVRKWSESLEGGVAGDDVEILLGGVEREAVERYQDLATPGSLALHSQFEATISVLTREQGGSGAPLFNGYGAQFYFDPQDVMGVIQLPVGVEMCLPGENVTVTVELHPDTPVALAEGEGYVIRTGGWTVGFGRVTKLLS